MEQRELGILHLVEKKKLVPSDVVKQWCSFHEAMAETWDRHHRYSLAQAASLMKEVGIPMDKGRLSCGMMGEKPYPANAMQAFDELTGSYGVLQYELMTRGNTDLLEWWAKELGYDITPTKETMAEEIERLRAENQRLRA